MDDISNSSFNLENGQGKPKSWLIGCGAALLVLLCIISFIGIGGIAGLVSFLSGEPVGLNVSVASPSSEVAVGEAFEIRITLSNAGSRNLTVSEIRLPNDLLANSNIISITPAGIGSEVYDGYAAYQYDLVIAPAGQETVVFAFEAFQAAKISGDIDIEVGRELVSSSLELVIAQQVAVTEEVEPTVEEILGDIIPYRSVVQIIAIVEVEGERFEGWTGSGTIISEDGLILTNAHVVLSERYYEVVDLVIAITTAQDLPPEKRFYADVIQADSNLDLAVIKIRSDLNDRPVNFSTLGIEPVPLGNSDDLKLGDEIIIIGYPGIGGETITLTRGEVSGFTAEEPYGNRAYIKTSATIAGGNSGGLAATENGEIIGVPTQVGSGDLEDNVVDCRPLADTNRDGVIDDGDNCVPTGGFINALRPIRLALPLIDASAAGEVSIIGNVEPEEHGEFEPEGNVILSEVFSSNINNWSLFSDDDGFVDILNDQMVFEINAERLIYWSFLPGNYDEIIMVAEPEVIKSVGDGDFGFICGYVNAENFTALEISEDGYYSVWKYKDNEYLSLVEWSYSDVIGDTGGPLTLAAYCGRNRLALAVNDTLLVDTVDPNYRAGRVGLVAGCWDSPGFRLGFENFSILKP